MKKILERLGGKKKSPPTTAPSKAKGKQAGLSSESIQQTYFCYTQIEKAVEADAEYGAKLLRAILADIALFEKYICTKEYLDSFVKLLPGEKDQIMANIMRSDKAANNFFYSARQFFTMTQQYEAYRAQFISFMFATKLVYSEIFSSNDSLQFMLEHFPDHKKAILDLIVGDVELVKKCFSVRGAVYAFLQHFPNDKKVILDLFVDDVELVMKCLSFDLKDYCDVARQHPDYTHHFIRHLLEHDPLFDKLIFVTESFEELLRAFPEHKQALIERAMQNHTRFSRCFCSFSLIMQFGEKYPDDLEKVFSHAVNDDEFLIGGIYSISLVLELYQQSPAHGLQVAERLVKDYPGKVIDTVGLKIVFELAACAELKPLYECYMENLLQDHSSLGVFLSSEKNLARLRELSGYTERLALYCLLLPEKQTLAEVISAKHDDVVMMQEALRCIKGCRQRGELKNDHLNELNEHVAKILAEANTDSEAYPALQALSKYLKLNATKSTVKLLAENAPVGKVVRPLPKLWSDLERTGFSVRII